MDRSPTLPAITDLGAVTSAWSDLAADVADAYGSFLGAVTAEAPASRRRRHHHRTTGPRPGRYEHEACAHDGCHCTCCVHDADLVVRARLYEQRIVPVRITNQRSRTRQITLELSEFTTSGGRDSPVTGTIATRREFELDACAHEDVVLRVSAGDGDLALEQAREAGRVLDVDDCEVAYADLRVQGCDVRPVRIAVALLPRDCDVHEVHCACGCC